MKRLILFFIFLCVYSSTNSFAVENSSIGANDGISSVISAEKLKGLEDWLYNLKLDIQRDTTQIEKAEVDDKEAMLYSALQRAFKSAGTGTEEFLTRNILIRGIEVYNEILSKDMGSDVEPKRSAFARRFLELHLRWAGELAPLDKQLLENLKDPYKISESEQRVEIGMEWAQKMVALSFSSPSNESHYNFLLKAMGYLFNDIVNDDRYNRKLGSTARVFVEKYQELKSKNRQRPLEFLEEAKDFREFLLDEFKVVNTVDWKIIQQDKQSENSTKINVDQAAESGSAYFNAFNQVYGYKDGCGVALGINWSKTIADAVSNGRIILEQYKKIYYSTCNANLSYDIALDSRRREKYYNAFMSSYGYKDGCGVALGINWAKTIAGAVSDGKIILEHYKKIYYSTCNAGQSYDIAIESK